MKLDNKIHKEKILNLLKTKDSWEGFIYIYYPRDNVFSNGKRCSIVTVGKDFTFEIFKKQLLEKRCQFIDDDEILKIKTSLQLNDNNIK